MSEKVASVQRKTLKDLQKVWRTHAQDLLKRTQQSLAAWKKIMKKWGIDQDLCTVLYKAPAS